MGFQGASWVTEHPCSYLLDLHFHFGMYVLQGLHYICLLHKIVVGFRKEKCRIGEWTNE